ncbi:uncharacterized protein [Blastocystis hominis]|uniref:Uncharacterized protein n=1 Tax=Blastocystis hominis TaxID=12968 RepID=D8LZF5_BLAHO|nr:uncharacterized protein [Blastocystis hominis]CBK21194.2 unnamed protein product [Blastocystis hominis]|eukprot:XP_012895242.1 uncharacterized protein [Blastocystis hominis]
MEIEQTGSFNDHPSLDPQKAIYSKKDEDPRVQYMKSLLKNVGITSYEDDVIPMLIEFKNEYTKRLLSEAKNYAEHARLSQISDRCIIEAEDSLNRSNFSTKRYPGQQHQKHHAKMKTE